MSNGSGPSKALIIGGVIIFIVFIGTILFYVFSATDQKLKPGDDQFVDFPDSPPNNVFTEPVVGIIDDPNPVVAPGQQNPNDEIRYINNSQPEEEPEIDQSDLDALAFLDTYVPPPGSDDSTNPEEVDNGGISYADIVASLNEDPDSIYSSDDMAAYFGNSGWSPLLTPEEFFEYYQEGCISLECTVGMDRVTEDLKKREIEDIDEADIKECGVIDINSSAETTESELSDLFSENSAALCIGEVLVDDCSPVSVSYEGATYLAGDYTGKCAIGFMMSGFANLCAIDPDPRKSSNSQSNSEIGDVLANVFFNPSVSDCSTYQY